MRFEYYVVLCQFLFILPLSLRLFGARPAISSFLLCIYGPAASLVKFSLGSAVFPLGSLTALLGIMALIFLSSIKIKLFYYIFSLFVVSIIASYLGGGVLLIIKTLHFLLYAIFGLLLGNYVLKFDINTKTRFSKALVFNVSLSIFFLIAIRFEGVFISKTLVDMRDVGFGLLPLFTILLSFQNRSAVSGLLSSLLPFVYYILSLTRSYILDVAAVFFYGRNRLIKGVGFKFIIYLAFFLILVFVFVSRQVGSASNPGINNNTEQYEEVAAVLTLTTRLNGLLTEWNDFLDNPIIGNGISYYGETFEDFKSQGLDTISDDDYIAYNHIGIVSVLAQGGIFLFILTIIIPLYKILSIRKIIFEDPDKLSFALLCLFLGYFILFFISGSPIRKDYTDGIIYYFILGYFLSYSPSIPNKTK